MLEQSILEEYDQIRHGDQPLEYGDNQPLENDGDWLFIHVPDDFQDGDNNNLDLSLSTEEKTFLLQDCCTKKCNSLFTWDEMLSSRHDCMASNYSCPAHVNHLNLMIRGVLNAISGTGPSTAQKEHAPKVRERSYTLWQFHGQVVCRNFFQFVFGTGEKRIKNEKLQLAEFGAAERKHGNLDNKNKWMPVVVL